MVKPNFFVVGALKSGTTAMCEYLGRHPEIFIPSSKEINYFGSDMNLRVPRLTAEQYLDWHYAEVAGEQRVGDGSVWYLYTRMAAAEIHAFDPDARIVIMLRNPVDALYSLHSQFLYTGDEDIRDFQEALEAETDRKNGRRIPSRTSFPEMLYYRDVVAYTEQVRRFLHRFGANQVQVHLFDDFVRDTAAVYRSILRFLEVAPGFTTRFQVINPNKETRNRSIPEFLKTRPSWIRTIARSVMPGYERRERLRRRMIGWNTRNPDRPEMDRALQERLTREFAPEVQKLEALLGRDLSHWRVP
jgi:hypothetical protein